MMKCKVRQASIDDLEALVDLKLSCTREKYRGYFEFAPLNDQDEDNTRTFFLKMFAAQETKILLLYSETENCGYIVARRVQNAQGQLEGELLFADVLPNVSEGNFDRLIIAAVEAIAVRGLMQVYIYLLSNNFRTRFIFEHIGFRKDGTAMTEIIRDVKFELLRYIYKLPKA